MNEATKYANSVLSLRSHSMNLQRYFSLLVQNIFLKWNIKYFPVKDEDSPISEAPHKKAAVVVKPSAQIAFDTRTLHFLRHICHG